MKDSKVETKKLVKNSLLLYIRMLVMMLISLITSRIVLKELGFSDYGLYNVVGGFVTLISFVQQSIGNATWRFITVGLGKGNLKKQTEIFNTAFILHILLCVIIIIVCETIGLWFLYNKMQIPSNRIDDVFWVFQFSVVTIILTIMSSPYNSLIIAHERMGTFAYISIFEVVAKLLIAYLLVIVTSYKLVFYAFLLMVVQFIVRIIYVLYCKNTFEESKLNFRYERGLLKEMLNFASYSLISGAGLAISGQGLNVLLNMFFGPTVNAARGIAVQVQGVVYKFVQSYLLAVNPQITKLYASGEISKMHNLISLTAKFSYFVMLIISVPLIMEMKPILTLWLGNYPDYTIVFCDLTICILMLETIAYPFLVGGAANGIIKMYYTVTGLILISMLPISYVALKLGIDPIGVYIIQLLISVIVMCWRVGKGANLINYPMHLLYNEIFKPVFNVTSLVFILIISFKYLEKSEPISYMLVTIICFVSFLITGSFIYIFGMKNSERDYLKGRIKSVIEKVK